MNILIKKFNHLSLRRKKFQIIFDTARDRKGKGLKADVLLKLLKKINF